MSTSYVSSTSGTTHVAASSFQPNALTTTANTASAVGQGSIESSALTVYFAGGLFKVHELHSNAKIALAIETLSGGRYKVILPQDMKFDHLPSSYELRDGCLRHVIAADLFLGQFDGTDADSGTVVEFCKANSAGVPSVLVRTDFRAAGDQGPKGDPWNLMLSHYPKTVVVALNSMDLYQQALAKHREINASATANTHASLASQDMIDQTANTFIEGLDKAAKMPPLMKRDDQARIYTWLAESANFEEGSEAATKFFLECLARKQQLGLL